MDRALREFRIRGVKTNIPFLENVIQHEKFRTGQATTTLIDTSPELFKFKTAPRPRDEAAELPRRRHRQRQSARQRLQAGETAHAAPLPVAFDHKHDAAAGHARPAAPARARKNSPSGRASKSNCSITDTTLRDAHQSLLATRVRTYDMLAVADALARRAPGLFSLEMWGGATFDTAMRFLQRRPVGSAAPVARADSEHLFPNALSRHATPWAIPIIPTNVVAGFVKHAAASGIDIFRIFDSLNYTPNLQRGDGGRAGNARGLRSRHLLHRRHPRSEAQRSIR